MPLIPVVLVLAVLLSGCTHTRPLVVQPRAEQTWSDRLNRDLQGHRITLQFRDGTQVKAHDVHVIGDQLAWRRADTQVTQARRLADVQALSRRSRPRGALDGVIIGALIGAPLGALVIDAPGGGSGSRPRAALAGGVALGFWTAVIGAARGSAIVFRLEVAPPLPPGLPGPPAARALRRGGAAGPQVAGR